MPPTVKEVDPLAATGQEEEQEEVKLSTVNVPGPLLLERVMADVGSVTLKLIALVAATVKLSAVTLPTAQANPGGGVSAYGDADAVSADEFTLSGVGSGESYTVNLPASATITSGDNSMTVSSFTHDAAGTGTGSDITFHIGGTLQVGAHQPAGVYSGTYAVSVTY